MKRPSEAVWLEERGFTLIEVMIALFIGILVAGSGYTVLYTQSQMSNINREVVQTQQNVRVAMELMTQDLRSAGFGMNGAVGACNTAIVPADNNTGGNDTGSDAVSLVVPTAISTLAAEAKDSFNTITLQDGDIAAVTPDGFGVGSAISINGTVSGSVQSIATDVITLTSTIGAPATFPLNSQVYWLRCIPYAVSTVAATCGGVAPCLLRNGVAIADGIEDLQLAYACDGCDGTVPDDVVDDMNTSGAFDTGDFLSDNTWAAGSVVPDTIRVVRVSIVARQTQLEQRSEGGTLSISSPSALQVEDHNHSADTGFDLTSYQQLRRRLYTRTVQVRNMGLDS
ncbi:PilW family protein [Nitrospiraceae bacterium AH_259_D15_M11_P09]|nr:PilW family protein [Nitrospiraceae bacterium AH_259_D15_M11_P09]